MPRCYADSQATRGLASGNLSFVHETCTLGVARDSLCAYRQAMEDLEAVLCSATCVPSTCPEPGTCIADPPLPQCDEVDGFRCNGVTN